jgi:hypothetical protein
LWISEGTLRALLRTRNTVEKRCNVRAAGFKGAPLVVGWAQDAFVLRLLAAVLAAYLVAVFSLSFRLVTPFRSRPRNEYHRAHNLSGFQTGIGEDIREA